MIRLIRELRQRRVFRGAGYYLLASWGILQVGDVIAEPAGLPPWSMTALLYLLVLGFPVAMILSWRYDIGEQGIVRTRLDPDDDSPAQPLRIADYLIILALLGISAAGLYQLLPVAQQSEVDSAKAREPRVELRANAIAVLPFVDLSQGGDQAYLGDGISDTVMHVLSQINELSVTARTSSFAFKGKSASVADIAAALAVAHILEGSVQRAGNQVRIIARLIDARSGSEVWSGYYDRAMDSIFAIQDEIAREVATALSTEVLKTGESINVEETYRPGLEAYEKLILGKEQLARATERSFAAARDLFEEATELDPNYPLAWVMLAEATALTGGMQNREAALSEASEYIARALDLDPLLPEAHGANAEWLRSSKRFDEAQAAIDRALELRPSYAEAYAIQSSMHFMRGETDDGLQSIRRAVELDPQEDRFQGQLARALWSVSRSEEAIASVKDAIRRNPDLPGNYVTLSRWTEQMGRTGEALYWSYQGALIEPQSQPSQWARCFDLIRVWRIEQAMQCLRRYLGRYPGDTEAIQYLSIFSHDTERAIANLDKAVAENPTFWYRRYQLADWLVAAGRWQDTIDTLEASAPGLMASPPEVNDFTTWALTNLAQAYQGLGNDARASELLEAGLAYVERRRKLQAAGLSAGIEDVQYLILLGREDEAMRRLEAAISGGWRFFSSTLGAVFWDRVRDDPRFLAQYDRLATIMDEEWVWFQAHKDDPITAHL